MQTLEAEIARFDIAKQDRIDAKLAADRGEPDAVYRVRDAERRLSAAAKAIDRATNKVLARMSALNAARLRVAEELITNGPS